MNPLLAAQTQRPDLVRVVRRVVGQRKRRAANAWHIRTRSILAPPLFDPAATASNKPRARTDAVDAARAAGRRRTGGSIEDEPADPSDARAWSRELAPNSDGCRTHDSRRPRLARFSQPRASHGSFHRRGDFGPETRLGFAGKRGHHALEKGGDPAESREEPRPSPADETAGNPSGSASSRSRTVAALADAERPRLAADERDG